MPRPSRTVRHKAEVVALAPTGLTDRHFSLGARKPMAPGLRAEWANPRSEASNQAFFADCRGFAHKCKPPRWLLHTKSDGRSGGEGDDCLAPPCGAGRRRILIPRPVGERVAEGRVRGIAGHHVNYVRAYKDG